MVVKISWPITSLCWILGHCAFGQFNLLDAFLEMGAAVWDWAPGTICGGLLRHPWWVWGRLWNQGAICCKVIDTLQILKIWYTKIRSIKSSLFFCKLCILKLISTFHRKAVQHLSQWMLPMILQIWTCWPARDLLQLATVQHASVPGEAYSLHQYAAVSFLCFSGFALK